MRQALAIANDGDAITFAVTGIIGLTSGGLLIDKNVTISGPGSNQLSIDGNQADFVFGVVRDKTATISGLTIRNGQAGIGNDHGALTISNCVVSGNSYVGLHNVAAYNGQTFGSASLTIANSIVSDNSGPGVYNRAWKESATLTILNSTLTGNSAVQDWADGGGIYTNGFEGSANITITNTTISGNSADLGGGIYSNFSFLTIVNSTVSGNSAETGGGGIYNNDYGSLEIANSTISGNSAGSGGGSTTTSAVLKFPIQSSMLEQPEKTSSTTAARSPRTDTISAAMMAAVC